MYVSFDDGAHWQSLRVDLPVVPVTDVRVHHRDLVLSTKGRGIWILDDVTPLHQMSTDVAAAPAHLFAPRDTYRMRMSSRGGGSEPSGENPPDGVMIFYTLAGDTTAEITLEIFDPAGKRIQTYSSEHAPEPNPPAIFMGREGQKLLPRRAGMNRFVWDLRYSVVDVVPDAIVWGFTGGPKAVPGVYRARLSVGEWSEEQNFRIVEDPRLETSQAELQEQLDFMLAMRSSLNETYDGVRRVRELRRQIGLVVQQAAEAGLDVTELRSAGDSMSAKLTAVEEDLMQTRNSADQDVENFPTKLDAQLAYVYWLVDQADARPTEGEQDRYDDLKKDLASVLARLDSVVDVELVSFETMAREKGVVPVLVPKQE